MLADDPKRDPKHEKRVEDDSETERGKTKALGSLETLGKPKGVQKRISLELETRTNNYYSKGIEYMHPESYIKRG